MRLSREEVDLFYKLFFHLLLYVNEKCDLVKGITSIANIKDHSIDDIETLRGELYKREEYFDFFICENPYQFSENEIDIVEGWKKYIKKSFYVMSYQKKYTVFLDIIEPPKAYGVHALSSSFEELIEITPPAMVDAVLLPFKDKIIFDSILIPYSIRLNSDFRTILNNAYSDAKSKYGIITSLTKELLAKPPSIKDELKYYLNSERNREIYNYKIRRMINQDINLLRLYHHEMGKIYVRANRIKFKKEGYTGWIGSFEDKIVANGSTREELINNIQSVLPEDKRELVYIFQIK